MSIVRYVNNFSYFNLLVWFSVVKYYSLLYCLTVNGWFVHCRILGLELQAFLNSYPCSVSRWMLIVFQI